MAKNTAVTWHLSYATAKFSQIVLLMNK